MPSCGGRKTANALGTLAPTLTAQVLDGDIDLSATLSGGTLVSNGPADRVPSLFILPMAERDDPYHVLHVLVRHWMQATAMPFSPSMKVDEDAQTLPPALSTAPRSHVTLDRVALADLAPFRCPKISRYCAALPAK